MIDEPAQGSRKVLYIEDDDGLRRLVSRDLTRAGYEVAAVATCGEGLELLMTGVFDVVALDHFLAGETGLDLLPAIQSLPAPPPVVYVTGTDDGRVAIAALKAGASDYVIKDVAGEFLPLLRAALAQSVEQSEMRRLKEAAERAVVEARDRAETLLREVNHRVGNSLQLVSAFVHLQSAGLADGPARDMLRETEARILAIAQIHRRLYTSHDVRSVDMDEYLTGLAEELEGSLRTTDRPHHILLAVEPMKMATDRAVSLGVIVTELVTNAFKYAYPAGVEGEVRVKLVRAGATFALTVEDDGVGMTEDAEPRGTGLGQKIVRTMASTIQSRMERDAGHSGTRIVLAFPA
ncbi:sensor histidine kinase [Hansschlegelia plantiphila]|uniref:histidine kinase n=1 Tax=Hansschlegelia plantiphila TaxID=374655 RepID=A0A9W6J0M6_9HYPH|nr:histidine kinase dimerization/phosphoacceptor domain -containing protein [Hansschlegelia plantiphila]GLK67100.1 two-component system sensor histidine kinase/response regulator [Hansschlegelia plantiphila]